MTKREESKESPSTEAARDGMAVIPRKRLPREPALLGNTTPTPALGVDPAEAWGRTLESSPPTPRPSSGVGSAERTPLPRSGRSAGSTTAADGPTGGVEPLHRPAFESTQASPSLRKPSTALPELLVDEEAASAHHRAERLAQAHEAREAEDRGLSLGIFPKLRPYLAAFAILGLAAVAAVPIFTDVRADSRRFSLESALTSEMLRLMQETRLAKALSSRDVPALRGVFLEERPRVVSALSRAGFELPEEAVRLRLVDAGQAAALSVDLPGRGDDPVAATARSGERKPVSPALTVGAALEVYLWETVAWTALGLALAASLWVGPLLRRRFVSDR